MPVRAPQSAQTFVFDTHRCVGRNCASRCFFGSLLLRTFLTTYRRGATRLEQEPTRRDVKCKGWPEARKPKPLFQEAQSSGAANADVLAGSQVMAFRVHDFGPENLANSHSLPEDDPVTREASP